MKSMKKRGISGVMITVLLILVALASIVIFYAVAKNVVGDSTDEVSETSTCLLDVDLSIIDSCYRDYTPNYDKEPCANNCGDADPNNDDYPLGSGIPYNCLGCESRLDYVKMKVKNNNNYGYSLDDVSYFTLNVIKSVLIIAEIGVSFFMMVGVFIDVSNLTNTKSKKYDFHHITIRNLFVL